MKRYEIIPQGKGVALKVNASTKAGLAIAALQGMSAASGPSFTSEESVSSERPFKVESNNFPLLLMDLLNQAIAIGAGNKESYLDIRFNLITDNKAEGVLLGKAVKGFDKEIKACVDKDKDVAKNDKGEWETTVFFETK